MCVCVLERERVVCEDVGSYRPVCCVTGVIVSETLSLFSYASE